MLEFHNIPICLLLFMSLKSVRKKETQFILPQIRGKHLITHKYNKINNLKAYLKLKHILKLKNLYKRQHINQIK